MNTNPRSNHLIRRIIGGLILALVFGFIFCGTVWAAGFTTALVVWAASIALTGLIAVGVKMLVD
jgi:hypothetical protein